MRNRILTLAKIANQFQLIENHRYFSGKLTTIDVRNNGIAVLTLNRPPVNCLNLELLTEISKSVNKIEDDGCKGLILTSSSNTVFSAGLDILELQTPDTDRFRYFFYALQEVWLKLYATSIPTAAAINGHAPAGGCLLGISCEYRVMLPNYTIGLNETRLGLVVPIWLMATMKNVIPSRIAEKAMIEGKLFSTDEAMKIGLIDEVATNKSDAIMKCEKFIAKFDKISPIARGLTKQSFRREDLQNLKDSREEDFKKFQANIKDETVQKIIVEYLGNLKNKKNK